MTRNIVVTGAGSGIGKAAAEIVEARGSKAIGLDLKGAEFTVDLTNAEAIAEVAAEVEKKYGHVDGLIANAGTSTSSPLDVKVNFFGAVDTVNAFRPLIAKSDNGRIAVTASAASLQPTDNELVQLLLAGKRDEAIAYGQKLADQGPQAGYANYSGSKRAIATWVRRVAATDEFAGAGIGINAVGPGVVETPMTAELLATEEGRKMTFGAMPSPYRGAQKPEQIAELLEFLVSDRNSSMTGQIIYIDAGVDVVLRGEDIWHEPKSLDQR